jgi:asparagine synthase (glutamine-hydrolysing)
MTLRYLALVWDECDPHRCRSAQALKLRIRGRLPCWIAAVDQPGLAVFHRSDADGPDQVYLTDDGQGVILGRLFTKGRTASGAPKLSASETESLRTSGLAGAAQLFWGRYVAVLRDQDSRRVWILRDPTGSILCFNSVLENLDVYFCRLADFEQLSAPRLTVNAGYLGAFLVLGSPMNGETAINEITEILPGERIEHAGDTHTRQFCWNPLTIASADPIEDVEEATALTREVVSMCVHAWASCFERVVVQLSGGLDSSILTACLRSAPNQPFVAGLNWHSSGSDTDERKFARLTATATGCELKEIERDPRFRMDPLLHLPRTPYPCACIGYLDTGTTEVSVCSEFGATALFYGVGGDWLFHLQGEIPDAVDYAYRCGLDRQLLSKTLDSAVLHRLSVWKVLRAVIKYGLLKHPWSITQCDQEGCCQIMHPSVKESISDAEDLRHPLFRDTSALPPVKFAHAHTITCGTITRYNPLERRTDPVRVLPFCSQPLMELSLRVPVDVLTDGGVDRAIARRAFANDLPAEVIRRKTKGGVEEHINAALLFNSALVREMLLDGILVQHRFLNRERLETALEHRPGLETGYPTEIWSYLIVEAWYRSWSSSSPEGAA